MPPSSEWSKKSKLQRKLGISRWRARKTTKIMALYSVGTTGGMHREMKSGVRKIPSMKGRRNDMREIWVESEHQDVYKYRTLKDVSKRLKEMREILAYVERPQYSQGGCAGQEWERKMTRLFRTTNHLQW